MSKIYSYLLGNLCPLIINTLYKHINGKNPAVHKNKTEPVTNTNGFKNLQKCKISFIALRMDYIDNRKF